MRRMWTHAELCTLTDMLAEGAQRKDVAAALGRPAGCVNAKAQELMREIQVKASRHRRQMVAAALATEPAPPKTRRRAMPRVQTVGALIDFV